MYQINRSVLLPYSAAQMFDLVAQVDQYPEFMPWCGGATIHEQSEQGMIASVMIKFAGLSKSFTTQNKHDYPRRIDMQLVDGPFSYLQGTWEFIPLAEDSCKVQFSLEYAFNNTLIEKLIGPVFNNIANTFIDSFTKRAARVYG